MKQGCSCPHPQYGDTAPGRQVPGCEDLPSAGRGALPARLCCPGGPAKQPACPAGSCPGCGLLRSLQRGPARAPRSR